MHQVSFCFYLGSYIELPKENEKFFDFFAFERKNGLPGLLFCTIGENKKNRFLIPNVDLKHSMTFNKSGQSHKNINEEYINNSIKEFKELFKAHQAKLKEVHNMTFEIKFGLIPYNN